METQVALQFHGLAAEIAPLLPAELAFLSEMLQDHTPWNAPGWSDCMPVLSPAQAERLIDWGRQKRGGKSILRAARFYERYEPADLDGQDIVEVYYPENTGGAIRNARQALSIVWACPICDRVRANQVGDLQVTLPKGLDAVFTDISQWVVAPWVRNILGEYGITFRPLKGGRDFAQALVTQTCALATDVFPVQVYGNACPGCGRRNINRSDWVEGAMSDWEYPDIAIAREHPLSIRSACSEDMGLARADVGFGATPGYAQPGHVAGAEVKNPAYRTPYYGYRPAYFAGAELVRRLLANGIKGLAFRPVHVAE